MTRSGIWLSFFISALLFLSPINALGEKNNARADNPPQEVFLSFSYRNLFNSVIIAYYEDGQYYLPVSELLSLLKVPHQVSLTPPTLTGSYLGSENTFTFDFSNHEAGLDGKGTFSFNVEQMLIMELDFFVTPEVFSRVFDLNFTVNFNNLLLQLETPHQLPVVAEYERARERERQKRYTLGQNYYPLRFGRDRKILGGGFLDYSLSSNLSKDAGLYASNFNLGAEILGGDLQGGVFGSFSSDMAYFFTDNFRWRYVWRKSDILSQFYVGQTTSDGLNRRGFVGIRATNEPIEPRYIFDEFEIEGETIPGSEVELYFNNALYGYQETSEDGHYRFLAPLAYGSSRLHLRIYDPAGGIIERARRIQVPFNFQPPGELNYHLNIGRLDNPLFGNTGRSNIVQGDLSYGVTNAITQKIGVEYLDGFPEQTPLFYSSTSARLFKQYLVNIDVAPSAFYRFSSNVVYPSSASWNMGYTYFSGAGIYNIPGNDHEFAGNLYLPFNIFGQSLNFRLLGNHSIGSVSRTRYNFDVNARINQLNLRVSYSDSQTGRPELISTASSELSSSITYFVGRRPGIPALIQGSFLRGRFDYNPTLRKLEQAEFGVSRNIFTNGRLRTTFTRNFLRGFNFFSIGITIDFNGTRSSSSLRNSDAGLTFTQNISGSVGYNLQSKRLAFSNRRQVGRSATSVRLFVDNNNSGTFDGGDEIIKDNAVRIGRSSIANMSGNGAIYLTQLQAYNRINMEINKSAIKNPLLVPKLDTFSFVTDPNQFKPIDIPFYRSGVISGVVQRVRGDAKEPLSGMRLYLSNEDKSFSKELRTFSDGTFYAYEIPPDIYTLEIDSTQLEFLNAVSAPRRLQFEVRSLAMGDFVEGLHFAIIPVATVKEDSVTVIAEAIDKKTEAAYTGSFYQIQLASYSEKENADRALKQARQFFKTSFEVLWNAANGLYAVRTAPVNDRQTALQQVFAFQNDIFPNPALVIVKKSPRVFIKPGEKVIQIGAFENETGARKFAALSAIKLGQHTIITYDAEHKLYKVRLAAPQSRLKTVLTDVKENSFFNDAFIATKGEKEKTGRFRTLQFIYQVQIEGVTAEKEPAFMESITGAGISDTGLLRPDKNSVIFDQVYTWKEAVKLKEQLSKVSTVGRPLIVLIEQEGFP